MWMCLAIAQRGESSPQLEHRAREAGFDRTPPRADLTSEELTLRAYDHEVADAAREEVEAVAGEKEGRRLREGELAYARQRSREAVSDQLHRLCVGYHQALQAQFVAAQRAEDVALHHAAAGRSVADLEAQLQQAQRQQLHRQKRQTAPEQERLRQKLAAMEEGGGGGGMGREQFRRLERRLQAAQAELVASVGAIEAAHGDAPECGQLRAQAEVEYKDGMAHMEALQQTILQWEAAVGQAVGVVYADMAGQSAVTGKVREELALREAQVEELVESLADMRKQWVAERRGRRALQETARRAAELQEENAELTRKLTNAKADRQRQDRALDRAEARLREGGRQEGVARGVEAASAADRREVYRWLV
jgi:hypothetical protein